MSDVYKLHPIEDMESKFPFSIWLPYTHLNSERFVCEDTKKVWHRFSSVTIYSENDDYPEDDLLEDSEYLPDGIVSWQRADGKTPKIGDVFQVMDRQGKVLFEETIGGVGQLFGKNYSVAPKNGDFIWEAIHKVEASIESRLGKSYSRSFDPPYSLSKASPEGVKALEEFSVVIRGIPFNVRVEEYISSEKCRRMLYENGVFHDEDLPAGHHWYTIRYFMQKDPSRVRMFGYGDGTAKEVADKLRSILTQEGHKSSLDAMIHSAEGRSVTSGSKVSPKEKETPQKR